MVIPSSETLMPPPPSDVNTPADIVPSAIMLPSVLSTPVPFGLILISAFDELVVIKASLIVN